MIDGEEVLGPKELMERGLAPVFAPLLTTTEVTGMAIRGLERQSAEEFVPKADVTETLPDGRTIQIAVEGVPIPMSEAVKLGLVKGKDEAKVGPAETKPNAGPMEVKMNADERVPDNGDDEDVDAADTNPPPTPTPTPPTAPKPAPRAFPGAKRKR